MKNVLEIFTLPLAHRGLHDDIFVENSLGAFNRAIAAGLGFELDVHILKDGTIVVNHDDDLKRLCGVDATLSDITLDELKAHRFTKGGESVPTLAEVLALTAGRVPILIELKVKNHFDPTFTEAVLQVLEGYEHKDTIALQSFNPYAMKWLKQHTNDYPLGQLSSGKLEGQKPHIQFMFRTLLVNHISHPDFVSYDIDHLPKACVRRARRRGMPIIAWTIDSEEKRKKALRCADRIIFEHIKITS